MSYKIRRWMSASGMMFDESVPAKSADEAIHQAERLAGIFRTVITDDVKKRIKELEPGEAFSVRKPSIKFTMRIRRNT